ncbi:MAG: MBL fold metallo-hydrolase [Anaerolineae bacterium]
MTLELVCLGTGHGTSHALEGLPSTAFVVQRAGEPWLLVDCGTGVIRSTLAQVGKLPRTLFITHNHLDHSGELPYVAKALGGRPRVLAHPDVIELLQTVRLHDAPTDQERMIAQIDWVAADEQSQITLEEGWRFTLHPAQHGYTCCGFVLWRDEQPLFSYSADSGYNAAYYDFLSRAPIMIVDARPNGGQYHASFAEVETFAAAHPRHTLRVVHHGGVQHAFNVPNVALWQVGDRLTIPC